MGYSVQKPAIIYAQSLCFVPLSKEPPSYCARDRKDSVTSTSQYHFPLTGIHQKTCAETSYDEQECEKVSSCPPPHSPPSPFRPISQLVTIRERLHSVAYAARSLIAQLRTSTLNIEHYNIARPIYMIYLIAVLFTGLR